MELQTDRMMEGQGEFSLVSLLKVGTKDFVAHSSKKI